MRILAIDFGTKRIGLAIADFPGKIATPLAVIKRKNSKQAADDIAKVIAENDVGKLIMGIPYNTDGSKGKLADDIERLGGKLKKRNASIDVEYVDETLTTSDAENKMIEAGVPRSKRKEVIDKISASILLQEYLEESRDK